MSVLVTGGAGYIGSHMVLELLDAGEDVLVLDNLSTGFRWAVPAEAKFVEGDIGDHNLVRRLLLKNEIDAVIHFAGSIVVPDSISDPLGYYHNNTCKSRSLLACTVEAKVPHFIFSSTAAVYGMPQQNPVAEDARLEPISPYGSSKLMTEIMLRDTAHAHDLHYVALRYFNVAGADPLGRSGQSTPTCDASDQGCRAGGVGSAASSRSLRHRLSDARRHLRPRLYSRDRSRPSPCLRA